MTNGLFLKCFHASQEKLNREEISIAEFAHFFDTYADAQAGLNAKEEEAQLKARVQQEMISEAEMALAAERAVEQACVCVSRKDHAAASPADVKTESSLGRFVMDETASQLELESVFQIPVPGDKAL